MMYYNKRLSAFTMLEVIMVIVILGIVSSIGSNIIANIYEQYIVQRATQRASIKTELAAQQIANLLSYRIPGSTLAKNPSNLTDAVLVTDSTNFTDNIHTMLEWISYDHDSFNTYTLPGWNGFCDLNVSNQNSLVTPGSNLRLANTILRNISANTAGLTAARENPAIFFRYPDYQNTPAAASDVSYNPNCMGLMADNNNTCVSSVTSPLGPAPSENLNFNLGNARAGKQLAEHYKLAWTAYAIDPIQTTPGRFTLRLYYNYRPWINGQALDRTQSFANIITNVTVFKFAESRNTFRFKLCAQERVSTDFNITICKEKAIAL